MRICMRYSLRMGRDITVTEVGFIGSVVACRRLKILPAVFQFR